MGRVIRIVTESTRQRRNVFLVRTWERLNNVAKSIGSSARQPSRAALSIDAWMIGCTSGMIAFTGLGFPQWMIEIARGIASPLVSHRWIPVDLALGSYFGTGFVSIVVPPIFCLGFLSQW
jgi:hypothetical protein